MRKSLWIASTLIPALLAGCTEKQAPVVVQLPSPFVVPHAPLPPPPPPVAAPVSPPPNPLNEPGLRVLPPGGISRRWGYIIIHHSDSDIGSFSKIDKWHRDKGWEGCGYDFVIDNGTCGAPDGRIEMSPRWREQRTGAHTRLSAAFARTKGIAPNYYNENGIGVVLVGNFDKEHPTPRQMRSLALLVKSLMNACNIPENRITTHGGVDQTRCPGRNFSLYQLKLMIRGMR